jgi:hypothetical protein
MTNDRLLVLNKNL